MGDVADFSDELNHGEGYVVLTHTPLDASLNITEAAMPVQCISAAVLLGVTQALGFAPYGFKQEKNGALVHPVRPLPGKENSTSSNGRVEFTFPSDGAYLPRDIWPQTLSLLCLIDQSRTATRLAPLNSMMLYLDHAAVHTLQQPVFKHIPPETFDIDGHVATFGPILESVGERLEIRVALHSCISEIAQAQAALDQLENAAQKAAVMHTWRPGAMLIFNNALCLHGRGPISSIRWLQRCYGTKNMRPGTVVDLCRPLKKDLPANR